MRIGALPFSALGNEEAYAVWRLRQQVFVVEQECPYPDLDGRDLEEGTRHVVLQDEGEVIGYARVLDAQSHLERWYTRFGFVRTGAEFLDDGIPHVPMRLDRSGARRRP